jgi:1,4-alpha-glucan branching enzyme
MANIARPIGELDLHLFGEGTHRRLWELLGPQPLLVDDAGQARSIRFGVWAPNATGVAVIGDWNDWVPEPLTPVVSDGPTGIWTMVAPAACSGHRYKFVITTADGRTLHKADPMARQSELPPSERRPSLWFLRVVGRRLDAHTRVSGDRVDGGADLRSAPRQLETRGEHLGCTRRADR